VYWKPNEDVIDCRSNRFVTVTPYSAHKEISMRRLPLIIAVVALMSGSADAQLGFGFGVGAATAIPAGDFSDRASTGWGGSLQARFGIPVVTFTGAVEYLSFGEKSFAGGTSSSQMWGFNVGARLTLFPFVYGGVEIGSYRENSTTTIGSQETEGSITRGSVAPVIGAEFLGFDLSARYVFMDKTDFTSVRLTYWF
jgi:hypothetical protein